MGQQSGPLDREVMVQLKTPTRGAAGGEQFTWTNVQLVWMSKRDVRANERIAANQKMAEVDTVFRARWTPLMDELDFRADTHRLVYDGRAYEVHGAIEIGRRESVEIMCAARAEAAFGN